MISGPELLARLELQRDRVFEALRLVVEAESPTGDLAALDRCAQVLSGLGEEFLGQPPLRHDLDGLPCLRWQGSGEPLIGVLGHFDTVHPVGSITVNPLRVEDDWLYGPGVFDMKAGIVQGLAALSVVGLDRVTVLLTPDEERGSQSSQRMIEDLAQHVDAVLVLEPSFDGALKTSRKGGATFDIDVIGREAHAGLEPQDGVNATVALAYLAIAAAQLEDADLETTVTPTTASSGAASNIVPGRARLNVDVRAWTVAELDRVEAALRCLEPAVPGAQFVVNLAARRVSMEAEQSWPLFELAQRAARSVGLGELRGAPVGGGSDGSLTAAMGTPTLDGLGAVGSGAHTPSERVRLSEVLPRAALVAGIVQELRLLGEEPDGLASLRSARVQG